MKIKTVKKLNLHELIEYVWENGIDNENYYSNLGNHVSVGVQTLLWMNSIIGRNDTFTVEVKEDLTEETELSGVTTFIRKSNGIFPVYTASASIRECLDSLTDVENEPLKIFNGITEIWNKDTGIPESGALEVDVE